MDLELVGTGRMGAVFRTGPHAVKFDRVAGKADGAVLVRDISEEELDAVCAAWELVAASGWSPHVLQPIRKQPFFPGTAFTTPSGCACSGMVTEFVQGLRTTKGTTVSSLRDVIAAGLANQLLLPGGADAFPSLLKSVLFQVVFTVAAWTQASNNGFRHNDLNAYNVCVTYAQPDGASVKTAYQMHAPDGKLHTFELDTPFRAVIVDFGFAAVLPVAGGTDFDERFYVENFGDPCARTPLQLNPPGTPEPFLEVMFHKAGMSHRQPCAHYDVLFFMYAVRQELLRHGTRKASAASTAAAKAYMSVYSATLCNFHKSALCFSEFPGRLRPAAQFSLAVNGGVIQLGKLNGRPHKLPTAQTLLFHVYFSEFERKTMTMKTVFGCCPSSDARLPHVAFEAMAKSVCCLAKNQHCTTPAAGVQVDDKNRLVHKPVPGLWRDLLAKWSCKT